VDNQELRRLIYLRRLAEKSDEEHPDGASTLVCGAGVGGGWPVEKAKGPLRSPYPRSKSYSSALLRTEVRIQKHGTSRKHSNPPRGVFYLAGPSHDSIG